MSLLACVFMTRRSVDMSHVVCVCANQNNLKSPDYKTASCVMRTVEQSDDYESHVVCTSVSNTVCQNKLFSYTDRKLTPVDSWAG